MKKRFSIYFNEGKKEPYLRIHLDTKNLPEIIIWDSRVNQKIFQGFSMDYTGPLKEEIEEKIVELIPECTHPDYSSSTGVNCHGECDFCKHNPWSSNARIEALEKRKNETLEKNGKIENKWDALAKKEPLIIYNSPPCQKNSIETVKYWYIAIKYPDKEQINQVFRFNNEDNAVDFLIEMESKGAMTMMATQVKPDMPIKISVCKTCRNEMTNPFESKFPVDWCHHCNDYRDIVFIYQTKGNMGNPCASCGSLDYTGKGCYECEAVRSRRKSPDKNLEQRCMNLESLVYLLEKPPLSRSLDQIKRIRELKKQLQESEDLKYINRSEDY